ncbi:MAG TPA: sigma 54-interacting transcriptional regulator [Bryobacteraceae bacterium]|nr:sigma 54-interacting transcriptional regulator [Bryobacteraceae bacterium]
METDAELNTASNIVLVIVGDNSGSLELLSSAVARAGLIIHTAASSEEGLALVFREYPHIVLADSGDSTLADRIAAFDSSIDVVLMTREYTDDAAIAAVRKGAAAYLKKPIAFSALNEVVGRLSEAARQREEAGALEAAMLPAASFEGMIGRSPAAAEMFSRIRRIAPCFRTVLVSGEPGSGKDSAAAALHSLSAAPGRLIAIRCAEMGAEIVRASGTLFLDEVGAMPLPQQAMLAASLPRMRVIASTSRDLRPLVARRLFREDLYRALTMLEVHVPRLADRAEDVPLLIRHFAAQSGASIRGITRRARAVLARYPFPGNIRQLEDAIRHACTVASHRVIDASHLPEYLQLAVRAPEAMRMPAIPPGPETFGDHERHVIAEALLRTGGNQTKAAKTLDIGRDALRYKMRKYGLLANQRAAASR